MRDDGGKTAAVGCKAVRIVAGLGSLLPDQWRAPASSYSLLCFAALARGGVFTSSLGKDFAGVPRDHTRWGQGWGEGMDRPRRQAGYRSRPPHRLRTNPQHIRRCGLCGSLDGEEVQNAAGHRFEPRPELATKQPCAGRWYAVGLQGHPERGLAKGEGRKWLGTELG